MVEELQEVIKMKEEKGQTTSAYQNSHNIPPTLLEHRIDVHICMELSMRQLVLTLDH